MKLNKIDLEICAQSLTSAVTAQAGGADGIELCTALEVGGLTPSAATIMEARRLLTIKISVLIRPRSGDFCYSDLEFGLIKKDILFCKEHGINGVVVGVLKPNQEYDMKRMTEIAYIARPMELTAHRAFDQTPDAAEALDQLIQMGYNKVLTSGQKGSVEEGKEVLKALVKQARGKILIMPGNGVTLENMEDILITSNALDIHMTAKKLIISDQSAGGFNMKSALANNYYETDLATVKKAMAIVKIMNQDISPF